MSANHHHAEHWLSLAKTAETLGSTPLNVLMHIKRGLLTGVEQEGGWLVDPDSLRVLLHKRREGETTAVCQRGCTRKAGACGSCF